MRPMTRSLAMLSDRTTSPGSGPTSGDVLLVFPGRHKAPDPQVPLQLLHVAGALQRAGHRVRIFDMRLADYHSLRIGDPLFVGITAMSGPQIRYGLEFARRGRAAKPHVPIVWGGVHPTLLPAQTAASAFVHVVVRGEAELVVGPRAHALAAGAPRDAVSGLTYKADGASRSTPDADLIDLDTIPVELPYDLLELDRYPTLQAGRVHIQTSRGCPSRCGFCYNSGFNKRKWRGKSPERVVDEMQYLLQRFPHVKIIDPVDDNLFVNRKRVEDICTGLLERDLKVAWRANCRFDYLAKYDAGFVSLVERAGCMELDFVGESGSERMQHYGIFMYTPFPSPLLESLPPEFTPPRSLEEWGGIEVFHFLPPWHTKAYVEKLRSISAVTRYAFYPQSRIDEHGWAFKAGYSLMNSAARYRWRHRFFGFPVELRLANAAAQRLRGFL